MKLNFKLSPCTVLLGCILGRTMVTKGQRASMSRPRALNDVDLRRSSADDVEGCYIVKLAEQNLLSANVNVASVAEAILEPYANQAQISKVFTNAISGFSVHNLPASAVEGLQSDERIEIVSQCKMIYTHATQRFPVWNIDRIDQPVMPLDSNYTYKATGKGVTAYILDTGIMANHSEFTNKRKKSRVTCGYTAYPDEACDDYSGHGTHVAGTLGGKTFGVAKSVKMVNVKIFDVMGESSNEIIISGIDYVVGQKKLFPTKPMIMSMSLIGSYATIMNAAVKSAVEYGIVTVVAAGNDGIDACTQTPAASSDAVTVASTQIGDYSPWWSNTGPCVDIFAPGRDIVSASIQCNNCTIVFGGTSMATPHVSGVAAQILEKHPRYSPAAVWNMMKASAVKDVVLTYSPFTLLPGTPNLFLRTTF